jgi:hypothetical protein
MSATLPLAGPVPTCLFSDFVEEKKKIKRKKK